MWGNGGRFYWGRKESGGGGGEAVGIVVIFAWLSSQERNLKAHVDLFGSLGWNSLVCHVDFLTLFFPEKATSLACGVLSELVKEVKVRPLPIVLTSFSGGSKGCLYKVLQLVEGKCEGQLSQDDYQLVRDCICGQIYDSSPIDFTSEVGTRFVLHPSVLKTTHTPRVISWMAKGVASGLDTLFINRFEAERADYWQTLYSSVNMGPYLIFCSENDEIAPYQIVGSFAQRLQELGGDVKLVKWSSPHVAHYKYHQAEYRAAVTEFLTKATVVYLQRRQMNGETTAVEGSSSKVSESVFNFHKSAMSSNESLNRVAIGPSNHFLPSLVDFGETEESGSLQDEQKGDLFHLPSINPHGVLSQILFDVCVPKNIEGWDIKPAVPKNGTSGRRHGPFNPIKFIRRSRL
ncbi:uncharacterized protein M6B38_301730 [Iris pallida]|uniref:DUF829 domain-containing protein n=1 Tax=Iris pallida TaxID=29817 RepID=A0AAX6HPH4_IRIPA|nr:uncharacterized protein M6B38_175295 [Iris pallida]KAJ6842561.1 uncharacterized protein M6B38_301730 [Iris pallida]